VAIAFAALLALVAVGLVAAYLFVFHYEAVARRHVPGNANLVVRVQAADVVMFGPVREHLWSIAVQRATRSGKSRGARIREATGVNLATDLREAIVASTDATSWVLIAGGRIARGRFVDGLAQVAQEEGWPLRRQGELLVGPGVAIGQAEDGTIVVGTDTTIVNAALPAAEDARRLGLPEEGAATFAVTRQAWEGVAGIATIAHASVLGHVARASGRLTLGPTPELSLTIEPAAGVAAADLARELNDVAADVRLVTLILPDLAGEKQALGGVQIAPSGGQVKVFAPWPYEGLDRGCRRLAELIGAH
jgi:hypothetical protein